MIRHKPNRSLDNRNVIDSGVEIILIQIEEWRNKCLKEEFTKNCHQTNHHVVPNLYLSSWEDQRFETVLVTIDFHWRNNNKKRHFSKYLLLCSTEESSWFILNYPLNSLN